MEDKLPDTVWLELRSVQLYGVESLLVDTQLTDMSVQTPRYSTPRVGRLQTM